MEIWGRGVLAKHNKPVKPLNILLGLTNTLGKSIKVILCPLSKLSEVQRFLNTSVFKVNVVFLYPKHLSIPNPGTTSTIMPMSLKVPMGPPSISLLPLHLAGVPCCRHLYATWIVLTALNFSATCKGATDPRSFMPIGCSGGVQS